MEIDLWNISSRADIYDVKQEFSRILHSDEFKTITLGIQQQSNVGEPRPINFDVKLNGQSEKQCHDGTGKLILPLRKVGKSLLFVWKRGVYPEVHSRRIKMRESESRPGFGVTEILKKTPFQDPQIEREHDKIIYKLSTSWRVDKVQFGIWRRRPGLHRDKKDTSIFDVEWEKDYTTSNAQLAFDYDRKLLRLDLGEPASDTVKYRIMIKFSNIHHMWVGHEFKPYICFDILTPPIFESEDINRTLTGDRFLDRRGSRQRVGALDGYHRRVAPYAHQVRIVLHDQNDLQLFINSCRVAGLRVPEYATVISERHNLFSDKLLVQVKRSLQNFPWKVGFQIEGLLYNGLLTTDQYLDGLLPSLRNLIKSYPNAIGMLLRDFSQILPLTSIEYSDPEDIARRFERFCDDRLGFVSVEAIERTAHEDDGLMLCHHVTFTPTRMLLEGPYAIQSNRVLRKYTKFHDYFLRVVFRDEDRLQFRWENEVDGTTFLEQRVGGILKEGFELAGRTFQFLAYSSSALREHSVWFVAPFPHPEKGLVTAASIRREIGDISNDLAYPSMFAARLALSFSATNPSVKIRKEQWSTIPDVGNKPYLHTDGVGVISRELGQLIWKEECRLNPSLRRYKQPSAYQIRFLGHKGVVCVDESLPGVQMLLRPSMRKFTVHDVEIAVIEIAKTFHAPMDFYLNQPLIMILEDRQVKKEAFMELLEDAIKVTRLAYSSLEHFITTMNCHALGSSFGLTSLFQKLSSYGLNINAREAEQNIRTPFIDALIKCAVANITRDIQYRCRIPVPNSYTLVGVADEGMEWIRRRQCREDEIFILDEGEIFGEHCFSPHWWIIKLLLWPACIQENEESEPVYLERNCLISRSPTMYPGDVRKVWAVGKPPDDKICAFRDLVNVIVFPSKGERSLASCLSGGDLDGDIFNVCQHDRIFGCKHDKPADFPPVEKWEIDLSELEETDSDTGETKIDQENIIPYVCDFVVRYINSDVLGFIADYHLIRADQSVYGVRDRGCLKLARLCSQAVDYPKNGKEVDISDLPPRLFKYKPDWKANEAEDERRTDFYRSERAIGEIFRKVEGLASIEDPTDAERPPSVHYPISEHPIYIALKSAVETELQRPRVGAGVETRLRKLFRRYSDELGYICATHTLTDKVGSRLKEEEVVMGAILTRCSRHRWRTERTYRMRLHASNLVKEIRGHFLPKRIESMSTRELREALDFAWTSWMLITDKLSTPEAKKNSFGLNSFSIIALQVVLDCLEQLGMTRQ